MNHIWLIIIAGGVLCFISAVSEKNLFANRQEYKRMGNIIPEKAGKIITLLFSFALICVGILGILEKI